MRFVSFRIDYDCTL